MAGGVMKLDPAAIEAAIRQLDDRSNIPGRPRRVVKALGLAGSLLTLVTCGSDPGNQWGEPPSPVTVAQSGAAPTIGAASGFMIDIVSPWYEMTTPDGQSLWCFDRIAADQQYSGWAAAISTTCLPKVT